MISIKRKKNKITFDCICCFKLLFLYRFDIFSLCRPSFNVFSSKMISFSFIHYFGVVLFYQWWAIPVLFSYCIIRRPGWSRSCIPQCYAYAITPPLLVNHRSHSYRIVVASFGEKCWFSQFTALMVFSREDPLYNSLFLYYLYYTLPKVVIDLSILYGLWSSSRNIWIEMA